MAESMDFKGEFRQWEGILPDRELIALPTASTAI
jgi:hypothetical protein